MDKVANPSDEQVIETLHIMPALEDEAPEVGEVGLRLRRVDDALKRYAEERQDEYGDDRVEKYVQHVFPSIPRVPRGTTSG